MVIDAIDAALTVLFWVPSRLIGYEKCSKCTVRVRSFQFLLAVTGPLSRVPAVRSKRADWELRTDPPVVGGLTPVVLEETEHGG